MNKKLHLAITFGLSFLIALSSWLVFLFTVLSRGGTWYEPNTTIAFIEIELSVILTFIATVTLSWLIHSRRIQ